MALHIADPIKKVGRLLVSFKWIILAITALGILVYGYALMDRTSSATAQSFSVIQAVDTGTVSSGIETSGQIIAAQKLDLDVYKQLARIDVVNIQNGTHVETGDILMSFDKSDASISARGAAVSVAEAELNYQATSATVGDPNTQIRTIQNRIASYEESLTETRRDFLNANLIMTPAHSGTYSKARPVLSGRYVKTAQTYRILLGKSIKSNGPAFTYRVFDEEGKIAEHDVIYGLATPIADTGLNITFTESMGLEEADKWVIELPNTTTAMYAETKAKYDAAVREIETNLANAKQELAELERSDGSAYRNLDVEKASLSLAEARQRLSENYASITERDIIAPFAGTIQDMQNVVVGATPTGGTSDSISLGTLISDAYLVTFTLDAADAAKVAIGQKVEVAVTSYANQPTFNATITEISSLPTGSGVAQYDISAKLDYDAKTADTILREGMLADIVVIQEARTDVVRVPTSAITYQDGKATVKVIDSLTTEQREQFQRMGIVRTDGSALATYDMPVELGVEGRFYIEVLSGLEEGTLILTTATTVAAETNTTVQTGFGGAPPSGFQGGGNTRSPQSGGGRTQ